MKTRYYKSLKGLINASYYKRITFNDLKKGVFIDINCSYAKFRLSEDALKKAYLLLSSRIYERLGNNKAFRLEDYTGRNYGILDRLYINNKLSAEYCAGQDEESEMKIIKTILRNNG